MKIILNISKFIPKKRDGNSLRHHDRIKIISSNGGSAFTS